jgi:hypothetical protein
MVMSGKWLYLIVPLAILVLACQRTNADPVTPRDVEHSAAQAGHTAAGYAEQEKREYVAHAQKEIDAAKAELDAMKAKARHGTVEARHAMEEQIRALDAKWKTAVRKLSELKSASADAWRDVKVGMDRALEDLKQRLGESK